ncbi:MAG: hypothetical protein MH137_12665 [Flavobacteriales bacterium]|nr:hypothetical protein [Flavobacteriales bacterium]
MKKALSILSLTAFILFSTSCRREVVEASDKGFAYYPSQSGFWWEFDVDSIFYNDFTGDTLSKSYILREEFISDFVSQDSIPAVRIERYTRPSENDNWQGPRVWWTYKTATYAVKVEENIPYVKLIFPLKNGETWNGNNLNFQSAITYRYVSVHEPYTLNGNAFDSTVTVLQRDNENLLEKQFYRERFARNVGMIEKEIIDIRGFIDSDNVPDTLAKPILNRIKSGVVYRQKIRNWGAL